MGQGSTGVLPVLVGLSKVRNHLVLSSSSEPIMRVSKRGPDASAAISHTPSGQGPIERSTFDTIAWSTRTTLSLPTSRSIRQIRSCKHLRDVCHEGDDIKLIRRVHLGA